jgi:predicted NBD/HSP70 family sugar kinase
MWRDADFALMIERQVGVPVILDNDVNVLATSELYAGGSARRDTLIVGVFPRGIGGAVIVNGRVYRGHTGMAGEIGHFVVEGLAGAVETPSSMTENSGFSAPCHCGRRGHLDCYATPQRIIEELNCEDWISASQRNDSDANLVFASAGRALGQAISAGVNIINPATVILYVPVELANAQSPLSASRYLQAVRNTLNAEVYSDGASADSGDFLVVKEVEQGALPRVLAAASTWRVIDRYIEVSRKRGGGNRDLIYLE